RGQNRVRDARRDYAGDFAHPTESYEDRGGCVARQRSPAAAYWRVRSAVLIRSLTGCGSCPAASLNGGLSRRSTTAKRVTSPLRYEFRNSGLVLNDKHPFHCPFAPTMQEGARMPSRPYILLPSTGLRRMARTR